MEKFGSQLIRALKFRDSFVMIGQKGLERGKAIEMVSKSFRNVFKISCIMYKLRVEYDYLCSYLNLTVFYLNRLLASAERQS